MDPQHRSLGRCFAEEIATPLGLEFYIRLPESIPDERLAVLHPVKLLVQLPRSLMLAPVNRRAPIYRR